MPFRPEKKGGKLRKKSLEPFLEKSFETGLHTICMSFPSDSWPQIPSAFVLLQWPTLSNCSIGIVIPKLFWHLYVHKWPSVIDSAPGGHNSFAFLMQNHG